MQPDPNKNAQGNGGGADEGTGGLSAGNIVARYETGTKSVRAEVQDYWLNHAFIAGHQWVWYNRQAGRLDNFVGDPDRVQATVNRLWPASRTIIAKLLQRPLTFEVLPSAPDDATMHGAATAEAILHDLHRSHGWEKIRTKNSWATWKGGTAAICVDWDPTAGEQLGNMTGPDGETAVYKGDTVETPLSLPEFVVEPGSKDPERARWWVKAQALPPAQVQADFNLDELPPADATFGMSPLQGKLVADGHGTGNQNPDLTRVLTYYERPNGSNKKGAVAVVVDNKIVGKVKPWPFPFKDRLNLAVTYETEMENKWAGESVVSMARPIQALYNLAHSNISEHMKNAGNARMAVPQSSVDLMETFSDLPGEMFPHPDGMEFPQWINPPSMPQWWIERPEVLAEVMDDLLGVHNVSRGQAPANIESGYGLSILAEHDSTPIGRMVSSQAEAWSTVATMVLQILADNVVERRTSMIRSAGEVPEAVTWSGKDLQGQTSAVVPPEGILPRSRAAQMAMAEKMVQMGLVQDIETFASIVELPDQKDLLDRARPDVAKARRENSKMALGRVEIPDDFDDHQIHILEHNVFRKSARYERMDNQLKGLVDDHIQAHATMAAELAGNSRQAAAIDPMLSTVPQADSRPTLDPAQLPPEGFMPGAEGVLPEDVENLQLLAEQAANITSQ